MIIGYSVPKNQCYFLLQLLKMIETSDFRNLFKKKKLTFSGHTETTQRKVLPLFSEYLVSFLRMRPAEPRDR